MIKSWGNVAVDDKPIFFNHKDKVQALVIGNCRSYGDVCLSANNNYIDNTHLRRIKDFAHEDAIITVESGVTLKTLLDYILPHGMVLMVSPGTSYATVGGCIANDVHGKNHETTGSFAESVLEFSLKLPSGDVIECSREKSSEIFWATIGGLGLTGIILDVTLKLKPVDNTALTVTRTRHQTLSELMRAMDKFKSAPYSVAWLDTAQSGNNLGRGILEIAYHANEGILLSDKVSQRKVPFYAPSWVLNKHVVKLFNHFYFKRANASKQVLETYEQFQYPLDAIQDWNKLYGRQGFYQFQCVLPHNNAEEVIKEILLIVQKSGLISPLAVLKRFGKQGEGLLSFPMEGYTLALDIPAKRGALNVMKQLEVLTLNNQGRVYPAKDYLIDSQSFEIMYPNKDKFLSILKNINAKATSKAAQRYGLIVQ